MTVCEVCEAVKTVVSGCVGASATVVRSYLETFDWTQSGVFVVVAPESASLTEESRARLKLRTEVSIVLFKSLTKIGTSVATQEVDDMVELLDKIRALFGAGILASGEDGANVWMERAPDSPTTVYNADALSQGTFLGGLTVSVSCGALDPDELTRYRYGDE